jgi:DNA-binding GntR family transcriptional regulator
VAGPAEVASQRVADELRERILAGRLAPGTRIIQDELAGELNTSRLPVREALRILESRGLVTLRANQGAWVTSMDVRECGLSYRIRERLEPLLLAESAPRLSDEDIDAMAAVQERIEATEDVEEFLVLDRRLHWAVYQHHDAARPGGDRAPVVGHHAALPAGLHLAGRRAQAVDHQRRAPAAHPGAAGPRPHLRRADP